MRVPLVWETALKNGPVEAALISRAAALVTAADAEAPEPADALEAATSLLQLDQELKAAAAGTNAAEDFAAVCALLQLAPHPGVLKALKCEEGTWTKEPAGTVSVRGWQCDLPTLTALLVVLPKHPALKALKFWRCGLGEEHAKLLQRHEPLVSLAVEGDGPTAGGAAEAAKCTALGTLSLRGTELPTAALPPFAEQLREHPSLTALSLFSTQLGDAGAALLLAAVKHNTKLVALNLGSNLLSDAAAQAVLDMVSEPTAVDLEAEAAVAAAVAGATGDEPAPPRPPHFNRTLTALNLSRNRIGTAGRALLEAAQSASPLLVRLELAGNPCLSCGPGASLSATQRASILASWRQLCGEDGGATFCASLLGGAFEAVPETRALAGVPEAAPEPEAVPEAEAAVAAPAPAPAKGKAGATAVPEAAAAAEEAAEEAVESAESVALRAAAAHAAAAMEIMAQQLSAPEALKESLTELGVKAASRGLGCGAPFDRLGEALQTALQASLGDEAFPEALAEAWRQLYAQASQEIQLQYTPGQRAEAQAIVDAAEAAVAAEAAAAAAAEAEAQEGEAPTKG